MTRSHLTRVISINAALSFMLVLFVANSVYSFRDRILAEASIEAPSIEAFLNQQPGWGQANFLSGQDAGWADIANYELESEAEAILSYSPTSRTAHSKLESMINRRIGLVEVCTGDGAANNVEICSGFTEFKLPQTWIDHYVNNVQPTHYLESLGDRVRIAKRKTIDLEICNSALYPVRTGFFFESALLDTQSLHSILLDLNLGGFISSGGDVLEAGACLKRELTGYDRADEIFVRSEYTDSEFLRWVWDLWHVFYPTAFTDASAEVPLEDQIVTFACEDLLDPSDTSLRPLAETFCSELEYVDFYPAQIGEKKSERFFLALDPYIQSLPLWFEAGADPTLHYRSLKAALEEIQVAGEHLAVEYALYAKWQSRTSKYQLGGFVKDTNTPLEQGVQINDLPLESVWGEPVNLPSNGLIQALNGTSIYSLPGLKEAMHVHGDDRKNGGVHKPIELSVYVPETGDITIAKTRLLFVMDAPQDFNTSARSPIFDALFRGLIAGQYGAGCATTAGGKLLLNGVVNHGGNALKGIIGYFNEGVEPDWDVPEKVVNIHDVEECAWMRNQEAAYAAQMDPVTFRQWEPWGSILPITKASKLLSWARFGKTTRTMSRARLITSGRALRMGLIEGALDAAFTVGLEAPSTPFMNRFSEVPQAAGFGFVTGFGMELLLPG